MIHDGSSEQKKELSLPVLKGACTDREDRLSLQEEQCAREGGLLAGNLAKLNLPAAGTSIANAHASGGTTRALFFGPSTD